MRKIAHHFSYNNVFQQSHQLRDFRRLKEELNSVKGELNNYDLTEWHEHTRSTNPAGLVVQRLKNKMKEFVTQVIDIMCERKFQIPTELSTLKNLFRLGVNSTN